MTRLGESGHNPIPNHGQPVPPPPLIDRLHGVIPVEGARARRTLCSLAFGHLAVLIAVVPIATLLVSHATDEAGSPFSGRFMGAMFAVGVLALVVSQVLSVLKLRALARATTDDIDIDPVAHSLRRSGWSITFALYPIFFGLQFLLTAQTRPLLCTLFLLLIIAPLLLEYAFASWVHRCLNRSGEHSAVPEYRLLPPGIAPRLRTGQPLAAAAYAMLGGIAAILLIVAIVIESGSATGVSPTMLVQIVAATAATAIPLFQIRAVLLVYAAVSGDWAHLPTLRRAGASFIRAGITTVPLAALVIASILASPAAPMVAVGRAGLLVFVLGVAAVQFASLSAIHIGDFPKRWMRAANSGRSAR